MVAYGVTPAGFVAKTQPVILGEIEADQQSSMGANIDQSDVVWLGQNNAIMAQKCADIWEILPVMYNSTNRGQCEGPALDNTGQLTGTLRDSPTVSTVFGTCTFTAAGTYAAKTLVGQIANLPSQQASNANDVVVPTTNPDGSTVSVSHPYTAQGILFAAPTPGPNFANALLAAGLGQFNVMVPVSGWTSLVDTSEPVIGILEEVDTAYRVRQVQEIGAVGTSTLPGISAAIVNALQLAPTPVVASVQMYENTGPSPVDANGIPLGSYMAVVFDGLAPNVVQNNPIIAAAVWNTKPAAKKPFGSTTVTVLDSQGVQRSVSFSRATQIPVYLIVNVEIFANASPATVQSLVSAAIISASQGQPFTAYGATQTPPAGAMSTLLPGTDVVGEAFGAIAQGQAGVARVSATFLGTAPNPTSTNKIPVPAASIGVIQGVVVNTSVFVP